MLVSYQMNVIFYDAMIMLPIVIVYLEELLDGEISLSLCLCFRIDGLASVLHGLYDLHFHRPVCLLLCITKIADRGRSERQKIKNFSIPLLQAVIYSIIGIATASVLLLPVFFNLIESKGQVGGGMTFSFAFQINPLDILSKLVVGGFDTTSGWSAGPNLPNIYIGAFGFLGFIFYFLSQKVVTKPKNGLQVLVTLVFLISFVNEFVSKIWHMGQNPAGFFFRFSWLFSFFMLVLAYQAMKQKIVISKRTNCIIGLGLLLSVVYLYFASV